jgi:branched-chain amino acid:cation transporter, LIVCS family
MRSLSYARVFQISLVIFAMLFGAGNLMLPLKVGLLSGSKMMWGFIGFVLTGVLLPLLGLVSIIEFDGDYNTFFGRLGRWPGAVAIFLCIMAIGPLIIMPRIVTLSYEMMQPFLPAIPVWLFALAFLGLVFAATYRPRRLLTIIGSVLSPFKIVSLLIIIVAGLLSGSPAQQVTASGWSLLVAGAEYGYGTLDLLATIFFGSVVVKMLKGDSALHYTGKQRIRVALAAGIGAATILGLVYFGMCFLGAFHGQGLEHLNEGQLFSTISFRVLGHYGAALIGFTVFIACFTTAVALAAVVTDYFQMTVFKNRFGYAQVLLAVLATTLVPASLGLSVIMKFSMPLIIAMYPVLIVIAACNLLYKLTGFKMIQLPVLVTFIFTVVRSFCR